jgi:hypothetical protein
MYYAFCVGQVVRAKRRYPERSTGTAYEILLLLPPEADDIPLYRVKSLSSGVEWVARQDRIESSDAV